MRFDDTTLTDKALAALEDVLKRSGTKAVKQTPELRFVLAWLGRNAPDRTCFDRFWKAVTSVDRTINPTTVHLMRSAEARAGLEGIYRAVGRER